MAETEAQKKAKQKYREKNRKKTSIQSAKSAGKTFIRKYATLEELEEYEKLIDEKKKELEEKSI